MDNIKLKYWVNIGLIISFLIAFVTGIIKFPGLLLKLGISSKGLPWRQITRLHDWSGVVMGVLVFVHLVQNWSWMVAMTKKTFGKK